MLIHGPWLFILRFFINLLQILTHFLLLNQFPFLKSFFLFLCLQDVLQGFALCLNQTLSWDFSLSVIVNLTLFVVIVLAELWGLFSKMKVVFLHQNGSLWIQEAGLLQVNFFLAQKRNDWEKKLLGIIRGRPFCVENINANFTCVLVKIGIPYVVNHLDSWRKEGVFFSEIDWDSKPIAFIGTVNRPSNGKSFLQVSVSLCGNDFDFLDLTTLYG